ncbi:hypothetical protein [Staphylococcus felis]|uniref:hypothetical protein n=1 Tax=Staphylococcus felis TaxID=46127 RepID=UPI0021D0297D|nr:hypothetical protein [Staphylococcus felis]UXR86919.1 hypothetical protein MUA17_00945 [Staphylococcus felis]
MNYNQNIIETELQGEWYRKPGKDWHVNNLVINPAQAKTEFNKGDKVLLLL